jgi:hypothetical protein
VAFHEVSIATLAVDVTRICHLDPTNGIVVEGPGKAVHPVFFQCHFSLLANQYLAKSQVVQKKHNFVDFLGKPCAAAGREATIYGMLIIT